jgi:hypothetical protein
MHLAQEWGMSEPLWMMGALRDDDPDARRSPGAPTLAQPTWELALAAIIVGLLALCLYLWHTGAERRQVEALSPAERAAAFTQGEARYRTLCGAQPSAALAPECARQARYLRLFPQCDASCRALTEAALPRATR